MEQLTIINPRSGTAFKLKEGQYLKIVDLEGEQVSDLICYNAADHREYLSGGRTMDYAETIYLTSGHLLYSSRSNPMLKIIEDTVGKHDFLLTPCSRDTFRIIYGESHPHRGCFGNLSEALSVYGIQPDNVGGTFNVFMNAAIDQLSGRISIRPPESRAGDFILLQATMDLVVGLTACAAGMSNNFAFKPIGYKIK
jgi:hypothetical protein